MSALPCPSCAGILKKNVMMERVLTLICDTSEARPDIAIVEMKRLAHGALRADSETGTDAPSLCPACAVHLHQIELLTHSLARQTDACAAISARLAERDHWIAERIAGERRNASDPAPRERLVNAVLDVVAAPSEAAWLELLGAATRTVEASGILDTLSPAPPAPEAPNV